MATKIEKNFVDFCLAIEKNEELFSKFMRIKDPKVLYQFFKDNDYTGISPEDCNKIIEAEKHELALGTFGKIIYETEMGKGY